MEEVAADHGLEPIEGFFFGGKDIDEWYIESLKYTVEMIDNVLSSIPEDSYGFDFVYQASW
jgi:hypothetical protein